MRAARLVFQHWKERFQRFLDAADHAQIDSRTTADLLASDVNLNNLCILRIELAVGKVGTEHQQRIAIHHGVIAGRESEESSHTDVIGVVILDEFFASQSMNNWSFQPLGDCQQFRVRASATGTTENYDF